MVIQQLLKLRKIIKAKRPLLRRQDSHKKSAIKKSGWRKPRGLQNKVRLGKKGYVKGQRQGFRSPVAVKNLGKDGLMPVLVTTMKELEAINPKKESVILASKLGAKKKSALLEKAKELKLAVQNVKIEAALKKITEETKARKDEKKARVAKKKEKAKTTLDDKAKKATAKKTENKTDAKTEDKENLSAEEVKKQAEAKKQKVLTKKQA